MSKHYPLLALLLSTAFTAFAQNPTPESRVQQKVLAADGSPALITFRAGGTRYGAGEANNALREQLQLSQEEQMVRVKTETDALGFTHDKYQQYYRGIKVEHAIYAVHSQAGSIESLTGHLIDVGQLGISPRLSAKDALDRALAFVGAKRYMWQLPQEEARLKRQENNPAASYLPQGELVIVNNALGKPTLAWKFDVYAQEPISRAYVYVGAATGEVVLQDVILKAITAPFATRYSGTRNVETEVNPGGGYRLRESTRGSGIETYNALRGTSIGAAVDFVDNDNNWTAAEHDNANFDNAAGDAHFGAEATYDYWRNVHGRNSWDNAGATLRSYVHFNLGDNAGWDGSQMLYGDGVTQFKPLTSLDVAAHEIGHGICQATANLTYLNESGALNEGFSDIWGACIEQHTTAALGLAKSTWLIGEEIVNSGAALRSMSDPKALGQPAYYRGQNWYVGTGDNGGVHTNSGVLNHWFYILSEGKSGTNEGGNSYSVSGISISSAARIAYRAESIYLTPSSEYADARTFTIQAANDLFGACSAEAIATANAWYAVGVGPRVFSGTVVTPTITATLVSAPGEPTDYEFRTNVSGDVQYNWYVNNVFKETTVLNEFRYYFQCNKTNTISCTISACSGTSVRSNSISKTGACIRTTSTYSFAPNPAATELVVQEEPTAASTPVPFEAQLYNGFGQVVATGRSQQGIIRLNVRHLPDGLYTLRAGTGSTALNEHIQITR